jgi:5-methylcytosine-specific restriction endonuclease McrA
VPKSTACARCGDERHYTGSRWRCSRCYNEWQTNRRQNFTPEQRAALREVEVAQAAARRAAWTPEYRAKQYATSQAWRDADPERHRAGTRDWYARNAEYARAAKMAEYRADPEAFYARNILRKARLADAVCEHGPKCVTRELLRSVYAQSCLYCEGPAEAADHFNPITRGGLNCRENIVPACKSCNSSKNNRDPIEFLISVGILIPR